MWWRRISAERIALLAGQGDLPSLFAEAAVSLKKKVLVFGVEGYTDKKVERFAEEAYYLRFGALDELPLLLKKTGVKKAVFAGGLPKREIYGASFRPDESVKRLLNGSANKGDDHLLRALQAFLKMRCGVSVIDPRYFFKELLARRGVLTRLAPSEAEWRDLKLGWRVAKRIGKLDIGQTVAVKQGVVLAVEAIEGTDAAVRRAGELAGGGAVVVKTAKPNQNLRFDLPCVGLETLASLEAASSRVLGVEAGKTLLISKKELIEAADRKGIVLVGLH